MFRRKFIRLLIILGFGILPAAVSQFFTSEPISRDIHIRSFRYGKDPAVIKCNRGDTLRLTFSTDDTGHSFFLEEFNIDVKVSPGRDVVEVFETEDPTQKPYTAEEVTIIARHPGVLNYLVSRSNYRCHVWCGPMHAFEHGKLIILPNTLLAFSLGSFAGILILWILGFYRKEEEKEAAGQERDANIDLLERWPWLEKLVKKRWLQLSLQVLTMIMVYVVVLTALFGTKMSGRNLGVLLMWAIWLFLLVAILTPLLGRIWCTICPLPLFGELLQRRSATRPLDGSKGKYRNAYRGLFRTWPKALQNSWPRLIFLLLLTTFSTTLVAVPKVTGFAVIALLLIPTFLAMIFEHRSFCRWLCPVSGFLGPFSRMGKLAVRKKDAKTCERCKSNYCELGSTKGWACPYGLNIGELDTNTDCGVCLECTRSCMYNNVSLHWRPFASEKGIKHISEAWLSIGIFTLALAYSLLYQGHWPRVRDYINILDKGNWDLFAIYTVLLWSASLIIMPALLYGLSWAGKWLSGSRSSTRKTFLSASGALLPMGLMLWISFVIPMLFANTTFVLQSLSDPFGWGWDFFGTASIPWHQFLPRAVPWIQAALILWGLQLSLRNLRQSPVFCDTDKGKGILMSLPVALLIMVFAGGMILFYVN